MSALSDRLGQHARDCEAMAEAIETLEARCSYYKAQAIRWAEEVERLNPSIAVTEFLGREGRYRGHPMAYDDLPLG